MMSTWGLSIAIEFPMAMFFSSVKDRPILRRMAWVLHPFMPMTLNKSILAIPSSKTVVWSPVSGTLKTCNTYAAGLVCSCKQSFVEKESSCCANF